MMDMAAAEPARYRLLQRRILKAMLAVVLFSSLDEGLAAASPMFAKQWRPFLFPLLALLPLLTSFLCFWWYRLDRDARLRKPSVLANLAIALATIVAVPVYLLLSRPKGARFASFKRLGLFLLMGLGVSIAGNVAALVFARLLA